MPASASPLRRGALLLAVVLATASPGCHEDPPPVAAAKRFATAAQTGNAKAVLQLVDAQTLAYAQQFAERAGDQIGGRRTVEPHEMLQIVDADFTFAVKKAEVVSESGDTATVRLIGPDDTEHTLELVREQGEWKVVLPTPPLVAEPLSEPARNPAKDQ